MEIILSDFLIFLILTSWTVDGAGKAIVILYTLFVSYYFIANITIAPSPVTTFLYQLASFTCEGTGDVLEWSVQGNLLTNPSNQDREISVTTNNISVDVWSSVLTIRALPFLDGTTIQCTVVSYNPFSLKQKGAKLTVKGKLNKIINENYPTLQ